MNDACSSKLDSADVSNFSVTRNASDVSSHLEGHGHRLAIGPQAQQKQQIMARLQARKREGPSDFSPRLPLLEHNSNIISPAIKRPRLNTAFHSKPYVPEIESRMKDDVLLSRISKAEILPSQTLHTQQKHDDHAESLTAVNQSHSLAQNKNAGRLSGEELLHWQQSWRKIMKESTVYFEGVSEDNPAQTLEFRRASRYLKLVGCDIAPFFDNDVTIIVSRRQYNPNREYSPSDIFYNAGQLKIKVWDYNKVFRFLKNLGVNVDTKMPNASISTNVEKTVLGDHFGDDDKKSSKHLYALLKEEKIYGTNDRDPNAKRDDLHYLERNYLYVYDSSQNARPIAIREWHEGTFPVLSLTLDGKCPFIDEPFENTNTDRKRQRRIQKFSANQSYRSLLKRVTNDMVRRIRNNNSVSPTSTASLTDSNVSIAVALHTPEKEKGDETIDQCTSGKEIAPNSKDALPSPLPAKKPLVPLATNTKIINTMGQAAREPEFKEPQPPVTLLRNSSCVLPNALHTNSRTETLASGYNGASNAIQFSMDTSLNSAAAQGNGLGPMVSQVPSRNLTHLKRRIIMKKQQQNTAQAADTKRQAKESVPGYCENCRVKYDNFDEHIRSNRHRNFACDDENFQDIDKLISILNESRAMGYVCSNGDFRYAH